MISPARHFRLLALTTATIAALATTACSGAAGPDMSEKAKAATAKAIPGSAPADITVSDLKRTVAKTTWTATIGAKSYSCDADDTLAWPQCATTAVASK